MQHLAGLASFQRLATLGLLDARDAVPRVVELHEQHAFLRTRQQQRIVAAASRALLVHERAVPVDLRAPDGGGVREDLAFGVGARELGCRHEVHRLGHDRSDEISILRP